MADQPSHLRKFVAFLASQTFFRIVVGMFVLQATWIALTGRFPMAFDEEVHFGLIKLYADHISPFWASQPASADAFGAITRDPSYLYHWLMNFPYQIVRLLTDSQTAQVLIMRGLNIALLASALPIYRRLLLKSGASQAIVHACLAVLVFIPIMPLLAAQINYDNLWIPLVGYILLLTVNFVDELKLTKRVNTKNLALIVTLCLLASLVKYAFLPIFIAIILYLLLVHVRSGTSWRKFFISLAFGVTLMTRRVRWLVLIGLIIASGLFVERYGVNLVQYQSPVADCAQVLNEERCSAYGPWARDNFLANNKSPAADTNPLSFGFEWLYGMWFRLFFAVDGPNTDFQTQGPLLLPGGSALAFAAAGFIAILAGTPRVYKRYNTAVLTFMVIVTLAYIAALIIDGYEAYTRTGRPVALNGRYLLVILPLVFLRVALSFNELLRPRPKVVLLSVAILCLLWGGGALTYILRSNQAWYWDSSAVRATNKAVQQTLGPLTPGYNSPRLFAR